MPATETTGQPIRLIGDYFEAPGATPTVAQTFTPGQGWTPRPAGESITFESATALRREGVTVVALDHDGRVADFRIAELLTVPSVLEQARRVLAGEAPF